MPSNKNGPVSAAVFTVIAAVFLICMLLLAQRVDPQTPMEFSHNMLAFAYGLVSHPVTPSMTSTTLATTATTTFYTTSTRPTTSITSSIAPTSIYSTSVQTTFSTSSTSTKSTTILSITATKSTTTPSSTTTASASTTISGQNYTVHYNAYNDAFQIEIIVNGRTRYLNSSYSSISLGAGSYEINETPSSPTNVFLNYTTTGGISVANSTRPNTTIYVNGNGTITINSCIFQEYCS